MDRLAELGFDWIWFFSVWHTGRSAQGICAPSRMPQEFHETLPDLKPEDIGGSGFAIQGYTVHRVSAGMRRSHGFASGCKNAGLNLCSTSCPTTWGWIIRGSASHPDFFVYGTEDDLSRAPQNYFWVHSKNGALVLAHGTESLFRGLV